MAEFPRSFLALASAVTFALALALSACATAPLPPLDQTHPASVEAAEAPPSRPLHSLRADAASRHTRELIAHRAAETKAAQAETPAPNPNIAQPNANEGEAR